MKTIKVIKSDTQEPRDLSFEKNIIIVGANGSGKTRFGSKIEQLNENTRRISAQRNLQFTEVIEKKNIETADLDFNLSYKHQSPVQPQNDYQKVLAKLFAEEFQRNENAIETIKTKGSLNKEALPLSKKEQLIEIWEFVFPNRNLSLKDDRVKALNNEAAYSGSEMSDGEKVGLYLMAQILLAENNCTLIIDEPELHLHKSLMVRLWNKLEESRPDCIFIYITHDLDFAASKSKSKIIWIQEYKNNNWAWEELEHNETIPENLFLEILGSREPILFIEGDKGSLDTQVYQRYYDQFTVIPVASCDKVIESVKGLSKHANLHDKKVYGLIDRDFRPDADLDSRKSDGIFSIKLNKIENLFLVPEIIDLVCKYLPKPDSIKNEILDEIKNEYRKKKEDISFLASKAKIKNKINKKIGDIKNNADYEKFKTTIFSDIDKELETQALPDESADIVEILKFYPCKGLVHKIQNKLDFTNEGYRNFVLSFFFYKDKKLELIEILKNYLPKIK